MPPSPKSFPDPRSVAEFRLMVLGDVLVLPPKSGEMKQRLRSLAERQWQHPCGKIGPIGLRTLQRWLAKIGNSKDRIVSLMPRERRDKGKFPSIPKEHQDTLRRLWEERSNDRWRNHYKNLQALLPNSPTPSFSSVKRFLRSEALYRIPAANEKEKREKLSFEASLVNEVWHLDAHHGSCRVLDEQGQWRVAKLIIFLDDCSRFVCHAQWYLNECCREMCHAFEQAAMKCGLPHSVYTDNGSGMRATEFVEGLRRLGVLLKFTAVESPYQNGKLERFWGTLESQLMQMVPQNKPMNLAELNRYTQAWLLKDYHISKHSETKETPQELYLTKLHTPLRRCEGKEMRSAFRRSVPRQTRTQDGTVQIEGVRFQLPEAHRHIPRVIVRYASWDLGVAELADSRTRSTVAQIFPVDKQTNSHGKRKPLQEKRSANPRADPPGLAPHLEKLCRELDEESGMENYNPTIPL